MLDAFEGDDTIDIKLLLGNVGVRSELWDCFRNFKARFVCGLLYMVLVNKRKKKCGGIQRSG